MQRAFQFRCETSIFPLDELAALTQHGDQLEALATGKLQPVTPEQEHFLEVDREEAAPVTVCERAWMRLKGRREYEQEEKDVPQTPPKEDYGIVEWDADRCWW